MRFLIILLALVLVLIIGGWLVIDFKSDTTTVEIRTEQIKQDASKAVEQASERLKRAGDAITTP